jgi:hypothetical protein
MPKYRYDETGKLKKIEPRRLTVSRLKVMLELNKRGHFDFDDSVLSKRHRIFFRHSDGFDNRNAGLKAVCDALLIDIDDLLTEASNHADN